MPCIDFVTRTPSRCYRLIIFLFLVSSVALRAATIGRSKTDLAKNQPPHSEMLGKYYKREHRE